MIAAALLALVCLPLDLARGEQDPVEGEIDEALRRFQAAAEVQLALAQLSARLSALGASATSPLARRLADDLRDGVASAAAPALIDALSGRPDALVPLQLAFRDLATGASGRIELANALSQLDDTSTWREGVAAIAVAPAVSLDDRLRALALLLAAGDPRGQEGLRALLFDLPTRPATDQRRIVDFLAQVNTPEARAALEEVMTQRTLAPEVRIAAAEALIRLGDVGRVDEARRVLAGLRAGLTAEDPKVTLDDVPGRARPVSLPSASPRKIGEDAGPRGVYKIALVGAAAMAVALLLLFRRRN